MTENKEKTSAASLEVDLMSTAGTSLACSVLADCFYVQIEGPTQDFLEDDFSISKMCFNRLIQSKDDKFLVLTDGGFQAQHLFNTPTDCKLVIQYFKSTVERDEPGRAAMLYVNKDNKKVLVSCNEGKICPKEMDHIPSSILGNAHEAVFFLKEIPSVDKQYMLQPSLYPDKLLGFESSEDFEDVSKLVLYENDPLNEACHLQIT